MEGKTIKSVREGSPREFSSAAEIIMHEGSGWQSSAFSDEMLCANYRFGHAEKRSSVLVQS